MSDTIQQGQRFAAGLRALAAWYDAHPEAPVPFDATFHIGADDTLAEARRLAAMLAPCDKVYTDSYFKLERDFGGVGLSFIFFRSTVCERRVVGTKLVPAVPAQPERTEEIVEWSCDPIFADREALHART